MIGHPHTDNRCADNPRSISRYLSDKDEYRELSAKLLCLMQTTLSGTLYVYQGEELGQRNMPPSFEPSEYKDIETINYWEKVCHLTGSNTDIRSTVVHSPLTTAVYR